MKPDFRMKAGKRTEVGIRVEIRISDPEINPTVFQRKHVN